MQLIPHVLPEVSWSSPEPLKMPVDVSNSSHLYRWIGSTVDEWWTFSVRRSGSLIGCTWMEILPCEWVSEGGQQQDAWSDHKGSFLHRVQKASRPLLCTTVKRGRGKKRHRWWWHCAIWGTAFSPINMTRFQKATLWTCSGCKRTCKTKKAKQVVADRWFNLWFGLFHRINTSAFF